MKRAAAYAIGCFALAALLLWLAERERPVCELDQRARVEICSDLGYLVIEQIEREGECRVPAVECND